MSHELDTFEEMLGDPDAVAPDDLTVAGLAIVERVRRAEAQRDRAVAALREIMKIYDYGDRCHSIARGALAELEAES